MAQSPASQPSQSSSAVPAKKPRSPAEKVIVYGGIVLLLGLVLFQARARLGYTMTLNKLQERMEEDEGQDANPLLLKDLDQYIVGWPTRKEESRGKHMSTIELTWPGLTSSFGLKIGYDPTEEGGAIMALETQGYVEPPPEVAPPPFSKEQAEQLGANIPPGAPGAPGASIPPGAPGGPPGAGGIHPPLPPAVGVPPEGDAPAAETPATSEPAAETPAATEPAAETPATTEPDAETPAATEPATEAPAPTEPAAETPAAVEPATEQPDVGK